MRLPEDPMVHEALPGRMASPTRLKNCAVVTPNDCAAAFGADKSTTIANAETANKAKKYRMKRISVGSYGIAKNRGDHRRIGFGVEPFELERLQNNVTFAK